jgi:hypothetical protein
MRAKGLVTENSQGGWAGRREERSGCVRQYESIAGRGGSTPPTLGADMQRREFITAMSGARGVPLLLTTGTAYAALGPRQRRLKAIIRLSFMPPWQIR